jgi:microcompartment protein CcmL/EutN
LNEALGFIDIQSLVAAVYALDAMVKAADVKFIAHERRLGGRVVTTVIRGNVSAVTAAIEAGVKAGNEVGNVCDYAVIANPHEEIVKFLPLDE